MLLRAGWGESQEKDILRTSNSPDARTTTSLRRSRGTEFSTTGMCLRDWNEPPHPLPISGSEYHHHIGRKSMKKLRGGEGAGRGQPRLSPQRAESPYVCVPARLVLTKYSSRIGVRQVFCRSRRVEFRVPNRMRKR